MKKPLILIPAFNEAAKISSVIKSIQQTQNLNVDICVVDDGSTDQTYEIAEKSGVKVLRHILNRGLGAAIATGFEYAKNRNYGIVVTFDADGQHLASDIKRLINSLVDNKADVVIGSRLKNTMKMPILRNLINKLSNMATYLLFGVWTTDSQSGLRVFNRKALNLIKLRSERMEVSSEIFKEISRNKLKLVEEPIKPIYTKYSLNKGQKLSNASNVFWKLIINKFSSI